MKLAYLGFGEAASSIASGLLGEGLSGAKAYDVLLLNEDRKNALLSKMEGANVTPCYSAKECVEDADLIISAVPSQFAPSIFERTGRRKEQYIWMYRQQARRRNRR